MIAGFPDALLLGLAAIAGALVGAYALIAFGVFLVVRELNKSFLTPQRLVSFHPAANSPDLLAPEGSAGDPHLLSDSSTRELQLERAFRLDGGYGPPGGSQAAAERVPVTRCRFCNRVRKLLGLPLTRPPVPRGGGLKRGVARTTRAPNSSSSVH